MNNPFTKLIGIQLAARVVLLASVTTLAAGCGSITVRHVPKAISISPSGMADLRGSQPVDVKAGACSSTETNIGTVGMGKVVGKLSEWTDVAVRMVQTNLLARGATITPGAAKILTITLEKAEVKAILFVGGAKSRMALTATTPDGLKSTFEASNSSLAPIGAVDGALEDAVKKLLMDSTVNTYLRK